MITFRKMLVLGMLMAGVIGASVYGRSQSHEDDRLYDQLITIRGRVRIVNHPTLGNTEAGGVYIVFQRGGCRGCLIATTTDVEGNYRIRVGRGRYRVIIREILADPSYDLLAPDQPRYVDATSGRQEKQFDINLVIPSNRR